MKTTSGFIVALCWVLTGCGGGSSATGVSSPPFITVTGTPKASAAANEIRRAYDEGLYILTGYGFTMNGVPQVQIGKDQLTADGFIGQTSRIFGVTTNTGGLPTMFQQLNSNHIYQEGGAGGYVGMEQLVFRNDATSADLVEGNNLTKWKVTLNSLDVAGQSVATHIKTNGGDLVNGSYAVPGQMFSQGAKAYTTTAEASMEMIFLSGRAPFVYSESTLTNDGFCVSAPGIATTLLVQMQPNNTIKFFETADGKCSRTGATLLADGGTWLKRISGQDTLHELVYPDSIRTGKFSLAFTDAIVPTAGPVDLYVQKAGGDYYYANRVKVGQKFSSRQPHFNAAALADLRALAGI